jgi:hypothetical protein
MDWLIAESRNHIALETLTDAINSTSDDEGEVRRGGSRTDPTERTGHPSWTAARRRRSVLDQ